MLTQTGWFDCWLCLLCLCFLSSASKALSHMRKTFLTVLGHFHIYIISESCTDAATLISPPGQWQPSSSQLPVNHHQMNVQIRLCFFLVWFCSCFLYVGQFSMVMNISIYKSCGNDYMFITSLWGSHCSHKGKVRGFSLWFSLPSCPVPWLITLQFSTQVLPDWVTALPNIVSTPKAPLLIFLFTILLFHLLNDLQDYLLFLVMYNIFGFKKLIVKKKKETSW